MVYHQTYGIFVYDDIALTTNIGFGFKLNSLFVHQRIAREHHIAKLSARVVQLKVEIGVRIVFHCLAHHRQRQSVAFLVHQHLLQAYHIGVQLIDILQHFQLGVQILVHGHTLGVVGQHF